MGRCVEEVEMLILRKFLSEWALAPEKVQGKEEMQMKSGWRYLRQGRVSLKAPAFIVLYNVSQDIQK